MGEDIVKGCASCRHHSKQQRRNCLEVGDGELEQNWWDDDNPLTVLLCRHPSQKRPKEMGRDDQDPPPGASCELYEAGNVRGLNPELERLLARREGDM